MAVQYYEKTKIKSVGTSRGGWTKSEGEGADAGKTIYTCTTQGATATVNFEDGTSQGHPPAGAGPIKAGSKIKVGHDMNRVEIEEDTV